VPSKANHEPSLASMQMKWTGKGIKNTQGVKSLFLQTATANLYQIIR